MNFLRLIMAMDEGSQTCLGLFCGWALDTALRDPPKPMSLGRNAIPLLRKEVPCLGVLFWKHPVGSGFYVLFVCI